MPVELVFTHGWGFDAHFWDAMAERLPQFKQSRVDLGFFGSPTMSAQSSSQILVGHSLGFVHGFKQRQDWAGWIAINSFPRFIETKTKPGCTNAAALRDLRMKLQTDTAKALHDFYQFIGASPPARTPNTERLVEGLDELRDTDIEDTLSGLDVPGFVLASRHDPLVPLPTSEMLGRMARKGGLILHDQGGHQLPQMEPYWCAQMIEAFLMACFDRL